MKRRMLFTLPVACATVEASRIFPIIYFGQSNCKSNSDALPKPTPFPPVRFLLALGAGTTLYTQFQDLYPAPDNTGGAELVFGPYLHGLGHVNQSIKVAHGATYLNDWIPGTADYTVLSDQVALAESLLTNQYPNSSRYWLLCVNQGEEEARNPSDVPATNWAGFMQQIRDGLSTQIGQTLNLHVCLTQTTIAGGVPASVTALRSSQLSQADYSVDMDGLPDNSDGVHLTWPGQQSLGSLLGTSFKSEIDSL